VAAVCVRIGRSVVIAAFGQPAFNFFMHAMLAGLVLVWFGVVPVWTVILVPLVLIPLVLLTLGIGFILALANAALRDVGAAVSLVMTFAMFISPVLYPPPLWWPAVLINYLNPVSPFIIAMRDLATRGSLSQPDGLLMASLFGLLMFLVGWRFFHFAIERAVERV
jgi:lipopolysaccharide transport system permease protein